MNAQIRPMKLEDYDAVIALWQRAGLSFEPHARDSRSAISQQIESSGHLMLVAEADGQIVGTVFGSHDGRKGWINRLAVDPRYRRQGLAHQLIQRVEDALAREGLIIVAALVEAPNEPSLELFRKLDYEERRDIIYFRKLLQDRS
ncbi:MAG: GNAT family N-acetyltransferase [Candidatus Bipolaricaulota bacterium]|nr:GNAT family N-acetyltransferase [Candidatus Bipolaricaulota bacterium]MDW8141220.1 GNAT family N-acetyltransferase [Candidatus Bipolaricaulota bacterium]